MSNLNEVVNCTEPSTSIRVPCLMPRLAFTSFFNFLKIWKESFENVFVPLKVTLTFLGIFYCLELMSKTFFLLRKEENVFSFPNSLVEKSLHWMSFFNFIWELCWQHHPLFPNSAVLSDKSNDFQHNDSQLNGLVYDPQNKWLSINDTQPNKTEYQVPLRWMSFYWVLQFIYCYAECRYTECRYAEYHGYDQFHKPVLHEKDALL